MYYAFICEIVPGIGVGLGFAFQFSLKTVLMYAYPQLGTSARDFEMILVVLAGLSCFCWVRHFF